MPDDPGTLVAAPTITVASPEAKKKRAGAIAKSIEGVRRDAQKIQQVSRQELEEVAEKYSRSPSTFLAAVLGGAVGIAGGVALGTVGGTLLIVTGPIGLALGAAAGVLAFRGRNYWRLERATQKATGALDFIRAEINGLPSDAPREVREGLYETYMELMNEYGRVAHGSIDDKVPSNKRLLQSKNP